MIPKIKHLKPTKWNWVVSYPEKLILGKNTDIGCFTYIQAKYGIKIEDDVQIGSHCSIYSQSTIDNKQAPVVLKKNCRIGTHSTVMPGVIIGENSVIGAHSFVNKNIPDNSIAYGVPCKVKKKIDGLDILLSIVQLISRIVLLTIGIYLLFSNNVFDNFTARNVFFFLVGGTIMVYNTLNLLRDA